MKTTFVIFILCFFITGCSTKDSELVIFGKTTNAKNEFLYLVKNSDIIDFQKVSGVLDSIWVNDSGEFSYNSSQIKEGLYQIRKYTEDKKLLNQYWNIDLYLKPNYNLNIIEEKDGFKINESPISINKIQFDLMDNWNKSISTQQAERYKLPINEMETQLIDYKMSLLSLLSKFNANTISDTYSDYLNKKVSILITTEMLYYDKYHNYYTNGEFKRLTEDLIPADWLSNFNNIQSLTFLDIYGHYASEFLNYHFHKNNPNLSEEEKYYSNLNWKIDFIKKFSNQDIKGVLYNSLTGDFWKYLLDNSSGFYKNIDVIEKDLLKNGMNNRYYKTFTESALEYKNIAPGKTAKNFKLKNVDGNLVELKDFKNKIIYIDFWGTWCPPCIKSIPDHLKLQEQYKDNPNVALLYIALEAKEDSLHVEKWKEFIKNKKFTGTHLIAGGQFRNKELSPYKIYGAPTYLLIDKGMKIDTWHIKPENISNRIEELLIKY